MNELGLVRTERWLGEWVSISAPPFSLEPLLNVELVSFGYSSLCPERPSTPHPSTSGSSGPGRGHKGAPEAQAQDGQAASRGLLSRQSWAGLPISGRGTPFGFSPSSNPVIIWAGCQERPGMFQNTIMVET